MSHSEPENVGAGRQVVRVLSWVAGVIILLVGLLLALGGTVSGLSGGGLTMALGWVVAGLVVLPPIVTMIRSRVSFFAPMWVPPLVAVASIIVCMIVAAPMMAVEVAATPEGKARTAAEQAEAAKDRDAEIAEIEKLVTEGTEESTRSALSRLGAKRFRADVAEGGQLRRLFDRATKAAETAKVRGEVNGYIARINEMMPKVEAVYTGRPETELVINANLETLDTAARVLRDGEQFASDPEARAAMAKLRRTMVQKQTAAFPAMRAGYGRIKDAAVWENDMDISVQGRTIRFTAGMFAANRNIASVQKAAQEVLYQLRFRNSRYEWYRGSDWQGYTMETPGDAEVGYWSGASFTPVPAPE